MKDVNKEQLFRAVFDQTDAGIAIADLDGRFLQTNPTFQTMLGYAEDELLGLTFWDLTHPDDIECERAHIRQSDEGRVPSSYRSDKRYIRKDGRIIWVRLTASYIRDETDEPVYMLGVVEDITARRQADEALRESEARLRYVVSHTPLVLWALDREGRFTVSEGRALAALGLEPGEVIGRSVFEVYADAPGILDNTRRVLAGDEVAWVARAAGVVFDAHYLPLRDEQGAVTGAIGVGVDVTERERLIEELEAKNTELERFAYTVSHDLKSPLVTIKGFLGLLEKDVDKGKRERVQQDIEHIRGAVDKMQRLLSELLDLSRIGRLVNPSEAVSLTELAREAVAQVAGQIAERGVEVDVAPAMPAVVVDRVRLLEVLQNLIDNAVKYMGDQPHPRIVVRGVRRAGQVVCSVQDNGIGIAPLYHEKIFGLFERLSTASAGTGIGLALARRIIEVHGGRIWVESDGNGYGATFCFTLPQPAD